MDRTTKTDYDGYYHLFPVKVYDGAQPQFAETASYYGVNAVSSGNNKGWSDPWAYWGAMAEWCDVNDLCVRQAYDAHGRRILRWENVPEGAAWSSNTEANAAGGWDYRDPLNNPTWDDTTVTEWRAPKCEGNFVRRHYNGFGQLTQEQRSAQGWYYHFFDTCGASVAPLPEVDIDYLYDGLGRQIWASVPHATTANWINRAAYWGEGYTITQYDALGRVTQTNAPNGEATTTAYSGRATRVMGGGRGYPNKVLQWTQTDGLGNLLYVRAGSSSGGEITKVTLAHDALGNLTQVTQPGIATPTTLTYDLGGRKVQMIDPDLGTWRYGYNRQGQLVRQTDANGWTTCLYYDGLGRPAGQYYQTNSSCPSQNGSLLRTVYGYDSGHSASNRSRGQLTSVAKYDGGGTLYYGRSQGYDSLGRPARQTVQVWGSDTWTTYYGYDAYSRVQTTTYPGGEQVTVGYGSLVQQQATLTAGMYVVGCFYNFCDQHQSLRLWITERRYRWVHRTPAMAANLTDHCWTPRPMASGAAGPTPAHG